MQRTGELKRAHLEAHVDGAADPVSQHVLLMRRRGRPGLLSHLGALHLERLHMCGSRAGLHAVRVICEQNVQQV